MEYVCVKLKQREKNKYRKLLSLEKSLYEMPDFKVVVTSPYSPGAALENDEWFKINDVSKQEYKLDLFSQNDNTTDYQSLKRKDFVKIDYLFVIVGNYIIFQNVQKSKLLSKKSIMAFGEEFKYQNERSEIVINDIPDAIYDKQSDTLYFKRLETITSIFKGIDQLYREATDDETQQFLLNDFIDLKNNYSTSDVKTANRKRIALAMQTLNKLNKKDRKSIFAYIGEYCPELKASNGSFEIGTEDDLKRLLFGIEQRFYTTPVGGEKRIANSIIPFDIK